MPVADQSSSSASSSSSKAGAREYGDVLTQLSLGGSVPPPPGYAPLTNGDASSHSSSMRHNQRAIRERKAWQVCAPLTKYLCISLVHGTSLVLWALRCVSSLFLRRLTEPSYLFCIVLTTCCVCASLSLFLYLSISLSLCMCVCMCVCVCVCVCVVAGHCGWKRTHSHSGYAVDDGEQCNHHVAHDHRHELASLSTGVFLRSR
jgi:hypothetical protein